MVALIRRVSLRMGWFDHLNERKIHSGNIPRLGGLGFAVSFLVFAFIVESQFPESRRLLFLAPAFALVLISGVRDDFKPMAPHLKIFFHAGAALFVLLAGFSLRRAFYIDHIDFLSFPGWSILRYPLTILWIIGMTNAVNLIDGVDGLAGGVSLLAALSFGGIFSLLGSADGTPLLCFCLASAVLGFLVFNAPLPRAKIFMGDGGAYFLGFTLALLPLAGDNPSKLPIPYTAAILMIPFLDTTAAVWRRLRDHRPIDSPDRAHTHHKLMNLGFSSRAIDAAFFTLQIGLSLIVFAAVKNRGWFSLFLLFLAYAAGIGSFVAVHFLNRRRLRAGGKDSGGPPGAPES
jgi:UDP-GlcNAc:undecaprenyl-phosphate GlcNAc-1-phosphate transferase